MKKKKKTKKKVNILFNNFDLIPDVYRIHKFKIKSVFQPSFVMLNGIDKKLIFEWNSEANVA